MEISPRYLVMVTAANNNKYYRMTPLPDGEEFKVEYGRLGTNVCQTATYPIRLFEKKYKEKLRKGYVDETDIVKEVVENDDRKDDGYVPIPEASVRTIVDRLQSMAKKTISENYMIGVNAVTQRMVDEAQACINRLINADTAAKANEILLELFSVLPRKMNNVRYYLADEMSDLPGIIKREQELLDVMAGQVAVTSAGREDNNKEKAGKKEAGGQTILDAMGLVIEPVTDEETARIRKMLGRMSGKFVNAWKVTNIRTQERFDKRLEELGGKKAVEELWHGSRNENWWNILTTGLLLRPVNAIINGKMFGYGLYFANKAAKSAGYMSTTGARWAGGSSRTGFLAIFNVIYGTPYIVDRAYHSYRGLDEMNYEKLQKRCAGADSLHAKKGRTGLMEDEIIVYREDQATIEYLVEIAA